MCFTTELYLNSKDIWDSYYKHPFVDGIGTGTLDKEKFKFYIIQDYLYLLNYVKVFALGVVKSDNEYDMKHFSLLIDGILNSEMGIHKVYLKKFGLVSDDIKKYKPTLDNLSYTNYMLSIAHNGGIKEITVALLACFWSYSVIAKELFKKYGSNQNFYGDWIRAYISDDYADLNKWLFNLVETSTKNCTEKEKNNLKDIFRNCSIYEYNFWDMAFNSKN